MTVLDQIPNNIDALKAISIVTEERNARKVVWIERLEELLMDFKRALFSTNSEKAHPDQYHLAVEDIETAKAVVHAEDEAIDPPRAKISRRKPRGALTNHLPRIEEIIEPDSTTCTCGHERHAIL